MFIQLTKVIADHDPKGEVWLNSDAILALEDVKIFGSQLEADRGTHITMKDNYKVLVFEKREVIIDNIEKSPSVG